MTDPRVMPPAPIESKVKAATAASAVASFVLWMLSGYVFKGSVPEPVAILVDVLVTAGATFVAGYLARHTYRP